jgi:tRNA-Thr(GGU) m(6)t(6)A37 methyltransferase TsaA
VTVLPLRAIGVVRTPYSRREDTPLQPVFDRETVGRVQLDERYADALDGLDEFTHAWLLTWLAPADQDGVDPDLRQVPLLLRDEPRVMGIFATRGPRRPNPIGLSLVRLLGVDGHTIEFAGVDLLDGTTVLDVKPYVSHFDVPADTVRSGWFDARLRGLDTRQGAEQCE